MLPELSWFGVSPQTDNAVIVTGPPVDDGLVPWRPGSFSISALRADIALEDPDFRSITILKNIINQIEASPQGQKLIADLEDKDISIGLVPPDKKDVSGYYLGYNRVIYITPEAGVWVLAHEGRHAQQADMGLSTILEFHQPGTALPWDARSYVLLNRVLDADADTQALAITAQAAKSHPDARAVWENLDRDPHFGPLKQAFLSEQDPVQGMGLAFSAWFSVGTPPRAHGYDRETVKWLGWILDRDGPIQAADNIDMARIKPIGQLPDGRNYLDYTSIKDLKSGSVAAFAPDIVDHLLLLETRLQPTSQKSSILPTMIKNWRDNRAEAGLYPGLSNSFA